MDKLKTYLSRVKTMSLKRMVMYAKKARAESGKPFLFIILDLLLVVFCNFIVHCIYVNAIHSTPLFYSLSAGLLLSDKFVPLTLFIDAFNMWNIYAILSVLHNKGMKQ